MAATNTNTNTNTDSDSDAKPYLHGHHPSVLRSHQSRTAQNSAPHLLPHLRPDMRVLDVGCGPGTITTSLAALVHAGHVTGVDYAAAVLDSARAHAASSGITNVTFTQADVYKLPFADGAFDVVHANQVLQHVTDPVAALREMRRVARADGGLVALREGDHQVWYPDAEGPGKIIHEWYDLWLRMARDGGMEPNTGRRLRAYALAAGFAEDEVCANVGSQCWSDKEELRFWCGMWADRVVRSEFADRAVKGGYLAQDGLERLDKAWREFAEGEGSWYAMLQGETICTRKA